MMNKFGILYLVLGLLTILVGILHFVMMPHLNHLLAQWARPATVQYVLAAFKINHIGSGIFLILIGAILTYAAGWGILKGKRWGAVVAILTGLALTILSLILWATSPKMFLQATPFRVAVISLTAVGILSALPAIFLWKRFEP